MTRRLLAAAIVASLVLVGCEKEQPQETSSLFCDNFHAPPTPWLVNFENHYVWTYSFPPEPWIDEYPTEARQ